MRNETKAILKALGYESEIEAVEHGFCPLCKEAVGKLTDQLSKDEYEISGMCQTCQERVFDGNEKIYI